MKSNARSNTKANWLQKAREGWSHKGEKRPPFAIEPQKGQRSVWDFPRPPIIEKVTKPVTIHYKDRPIANSKDALAVLETASPPTYYIPEQDIDISMLVCMPRKTSLCEWKGSAVYWALKDMTDLPVAWSYPKPFSEFEGLKHHLAFYPQYLDCKVDGIKVLPQPGRFYAGWITPDLVGPFKGNPGTEHW
ncbi:DUF427 domain-containing protein [Ulvibacterium sp.]|uniref:DUF427 domain-containing protein n=1 Tax=Ulvibacterium sp. TaxID=2665914 RepID=UPI003CC532B9